MKTTEFIDALEAQKIVPTDILGKLRRKIEKTDKDVSAKSIAKYLIDKGYLSKFQAKQILTGEVKAAAREELDLQVPEEQVNDTNELLKDLNPAAQSPKPDVTRVFNENEAVAGGYDASIEVVDVAVEETIQHGMEDVVANVGGADFDPLGGGGGFDSQYDDVQEVADSPLDAFRGKKAKKNQWDSKWIFIGSAGLALLCMIGAILAFTIFKADSTKAWDSANEDFVEARWPGALEKLKRYIEDFPRDEKVHQAKVMIANCELRIPYNGKQWGTTLTRSQTVLPKLLQELEAEEKTELFGDLRGDLGVILPGTGIGFTDKGLESNDVEVKKEQLKLAEEMMVLIDNPTYVPGSEKRKPAVNESLKLLSDNMAKIRRQITMEHEYVTAVSSMDELTEQGDTNLAFKTFEELVSIYPELRTREGIEESLDKISLREAELVEAIDPELAPAELPESPIASSIVLANKTGRTITGFSGEMLTYLINGSVYGLKAVDGNVVWRKFVGVESDIEPIWLGDPNKSSSDILVIDSRHNDLMRISSADGSERWRIRIGEPFAAPNVTEIGLLVTTHSGKVMVIEPGDGAVLQAAQVPKKTSVSATIIGDSPFIYQVADDSNVYVISTEDMSCREVYYLGHDSGSVSVPPFVMAGHLIFAVNAPGYCNLKVIKPFDNGLSLDKAQVSIRINGQVRTPLAQYGRRGLVLSETGDLRMLEVNKGNEEEPVTVVVKQKVARDRKSRNYLVAGDGQLWLSGAGLKRYRVQKAVGKFKEDAIANNLDVFTGSTVLISDTLFHVRRRHSSSMVSVSAVDPISLEEIWRNDLGAPLAGSPLSAGNVVYAVSAQGDVFELDQETIDAGVSNSAKIRGSNVVQTLLFNNVVDFGEKFVMTGPVTRKAMLAVDMSDRPPSFLTNLKLQSPADQPTCLPIAFGDYLLVAAKRGVYRVDPKSGRSVGAPFGPATSPNQSTVWRVPVAINDSRFIIGDENGRIFLVEADGEKSLQKLDEMEQNGDLISAMIGVDGAAYAVSRDDSGDRVVMIPFADKLETAFESDLPAGYVAGPFAISDTNLIVLLDSGETVCFNSRLEQLWQVTLPEDGSDRLAGKPTMLDDRLVMAFESGKVLAIDPQTGQINGSVDLQQPIAYPPIKIGDKYFVTGADGALHQLQGLSL